MVCERLVHPLSQLDPHHFEGGWALVAGSLNHAPSMEALKLRDSITMFFSNSDCVVMRWIVQSSKRRSMDMYLLSRRREVEQKELEEFRHQLNCYGLPTPVVMDPTKESCPDQPESEPTAATEAQVEEKTEEQKA
ncbi:hypothetical protein CgunFtcFv8_022083 [Champsocephalus gunnari]|uniref:Apolipoprotein M n=1 Tax=Champsocephalus gunnari TaxID=52237 RepID=A0AAN8DNT6_CHAGU|nr:hypothetical protein CgunFtcFv8_022083 [Champsocephalus gunnari]